MSENRVRCQAAGCRNSILVATAARTGGICRPCEQEIAREEHAAYVRANQREVDRYAGVTDPVELIALLVAPKKYDELVIEKPFPFDVATFYGSLSAFDLQRLIELAVSYLPEREDAAADIGRCLAAFTAADLSVLQNAWIESGSYYPGLLFRRAPASIRDRIIQDVKSGEANLNHALGALAWIGDRVVVELFAQWRADVPKWRSELYVPPEAYAHVAGWELDDRNARRDLFSSTAFALVAAAGKAARSPVEVLTADGKKCPWCKGRLTTLFKFDLPELLLPEQVVTCASCTSYGTLFMKLDGAGTPRWHPRNVKPEYFEAEPVEPLTGATRLVLGDRRGPLHAADLFLPTSFSQIGGLPTWIQDSDYPRCPDCRRTMRFIAQVSLDDMDVGWEGVFYAFWCENCRVTAASHQQT